VQHESATIVSFDAGRDYDQYLDGMERFDGVRSLLKSRVAG
jgi:hypothetical protein